MTNNYFEFLKLEDIISYLDKAIDKILKDNNIKERPEFKLSVHYTDETGYDISSVELNAKHYTDDSFGVNASEAGIWWYKYNKYDYKIREYIAVYDYSEFKY